MKNQKTTTTKKEAISVLTVKGKRKANEQTTDVIYKDMMMEDIFQLGNQAIH